MTSEIFKRKITKDQARDTGMAMVLIFLLFAVSKKQHPGYVYVAIALLVIDMVYPLIYKPVAYVWLGFSDVIGAVMSRVLLSIVFFLVVTPIAIFRRIAGKDALKLRAFKGSRESIMLKRDHLFTAQDLESPY